MGKIIIKKTKEEIYTPERAAKISATHKARGIKPNPIFSIATQFKNGMKMSKEIIEKRTKSVLGKKRPRQSLLMRGEKCNFWKGGITLINNKIRNSYEYKLWRESVFKRDNFTCRFCNTKGGKLNADHIKPFYQYPELRFAIDNGRTLCRECHKKTDTWGRPKKYGKNS